MLDDLPLDKQPHEAGIAMCGECGFEWMAVCPFGVQTYECPECEEMAGFMIFRNFLKGKSVDK